ncbi:MAG: ATP-binding cassette domain-containing protein [Bacteroidetes bacterium]|nr:ATP-binding cassette domain-containing protein [Bacteroidota bacterium]
MQDALLIIKNLEKGFTLDKRSLSAMGEKSLVVKDVSMEIQRGMVTGLIGGNGAGKTTILNLINGLLKPESGEIWYRNKGKTAACHQLPPNRIARLGIGRLFQGTQWSPDLTVKENIMLMLLDPRLERPFYNILRYARYRDLAEELDRKINERLVTFLPYMDIKPLLPVKAEELSFAQQRQLAFVTLLISDHDLIILDEPVSGISEGDWKWMGEGIRDFVSRGRSVLLIEHNVDFIRNYVDHCYYISSGSILFSGTTEEVLNHPDVRHEYLSVC